MTIDVIVLLAHGFDYSSQGNELFIPVGGTDTLHITEDLQMFMIINGCEIWFEEYFLYLDEINDVYWSLTGKELTMEW